MLDCEKLGHNHSEDRVSLYCGYAKPYELCGYHYTYLRPKDYITLAEKED